MTLEIVQIPCLEDNYAYLCHDYDADLTAAIDTPDVAAIMTVLEEKNWQLSHILNTHHHWDHTGGNLQLKAETACTIIAAEKDSERIPGIDQEVNGGDVITFGANMIDVYETPGHTSGHIVYKLLDQPNDQPIAFVGDTLFSLGCGRLFEGTAAQMWQSLQKIMQWSDDTLIYCAHEYTQANANFALSIEPENIDLKNRYEEIIALRESGRATIPTTIGLEKKTNPFLRPDSLEIQSKIDMINRPLDQVFAKIRQLKDNF